MAIDQKPKQAKNQTEGPKPLQLRDNPEIKAKIEAHKAANPDDVTYYTRLVKEAPERAIDTFIYKDVQRYEGEMRLVEKQLPQAREFYEKQSPEAKARIERDLEGVKPYLKDKAFVNAVFRETGRRGGSSRAQSEKGRCHSRCRRPKSRCNTSKRPERAQRAPV